METTLEEYYEELEDDLDRKLATRERKINKPKMIVDNEGAKLVNKLISDRGKRDA